jgi:dihydrofolate reductase
MGRIVVMNHVTLDGVMQGPGRADEDPRGEFRQSGWASWAGGGYETQQAMGKRIVAGGGLAGWLFGRWTYEELLSYWNRPQAISPEFGPMLNSAPKYVASTTLQEPLPWPNSTLLRGEVDRAVGDLKVPSEGVLAIMGSGELIGALSAADLIDEYLLMVHPLVLGAGRRLFPQGVQMLLRLTESVTTATGVVIATYERAGGAGNQ